MNYAKPIDRKSSDLCWPLKTATGETWAERKEREKAGK